MIKSHKELTIWQKSIELVKEIYKITKRLPVDEMYVLSNQMRRSAISVPSNIAEGYNRRSRTEYIRFLSIGNASSYELETQLIIAKEIYPKIDYLKAEQLLDEIQKMFSAMLKTLVLQPSTLVPKPSTLKHA